MELPLPIKGYHVGGVAKKQPPFTSCSMRNFRPFDAEEERGRLGQRPGTVKAFDTQVGGDHPIIRMVQIATIYIEPSV
jgi:hypothetical protein